MLGENGEVGNLDIFRIDEMNRPKRRIFPSHFFDLEIFTVKTLKKPRSLELQIFRISRPPINSFAVYQPFAGQNHVFYVFAVKNRAVESFFARCETVTCDTVAWPRQPVYLKTGSETGFLAQNLARLLDRDFRGRILDGKAKQVFKTETGF